jgi:hypothetical protein
VGGTGRKLGADESTYLMHTAISLGGHHWLEPVTDEEYAAAVRRPQ